MRVYLIGFMGVGKSYLGQALAQHLGVGFVDLDDTIEQRAGRSIADYFQEFGEDAFRNLESECLRASSAQDNIVVATGGGAPCFHENMAWMNEHGITIYLHTTAEILAKRLSSEADKRPLIANIPSEDLGKFIEAKLAEREKFYGHCQLQFEVPEVGLAGIEVLAKYLNRFFSKIF